MTDHEERIRELEARVLILTKALNTVLSYAKLIANTHTIDRDAIDKILMGIPITQRTAEDE